MIVGTEDASIPAPNSLVLVERIPGAWLVQIHGGGHGAFGSIHMNFLGCYRHFLQLQQTLGDEKVGVYY